MVGALSAGLAVGGAAIAIVGIATVRSDGIRHGGYLVVLGASTLLGLFALAAACLMGRTAIDPATAQVRPAPVRAARRLVTLGLALLATGPALAVIVAIIAREDIILAIMMAAVLGLFVFLPGPVHRLLNALLARDARHEPSTVE
jgi:hypothetical protein